MLRPIRAVQAWNVFVEGGTVGATPAVISAILDALGPYGVTDIQLPATPERILQAVRRARQ